MGMEQGRKSDNVTLRNFAGVTKFHNPCEISCENASMAPYFRVVAQPCKNNTGKTNKKQENEMKNKMKKIF